LRSDGNGECTQVRVIIGTDGSDLAIDAARHARRILAPDAEFVLASAFLPEEYDGTGFAGPTVLPGEAVELEREHQLDAESAITRTASAAGFVDVEHVLVPGDPGPALCRLAAEQDADVVVVGSHGRGAIRRAMLGSVSDHVVRHAPCPALVVGPGVTAGSPTAR
jgi:nucleotide-binding universal stress UspA family protein